MFQKKTGKWLFRGLLLASCLLSAGMSEVAYAEEEQAEIVQVVTQSMPEVVTEAVREGTISKKIVLDITEEQTPELIGLTTQQLPALSDTESLSWYGRMAELPEYAQDLYEWMIENTDGDSMEESENPYSTDALIDVTKATELNDGSYVLPFVQYDMSVTFEAVTDEVTDEQGQVTEAAIVAYLNSQMGEVLSPTFYETAKYVYGIAAAFDRDYPEVFWLSGSYSLWYSASWENAYYDETSGDLSVTYEQLIVLDLKTVGEDSFDIRAEKYQTVESITETIKERDQKVQSILAGMENPEEMTVYQKALYFNDWLTKHNSYNSSENLNTIGHDCRECTGALFEQTGTEGPVCEAYARAFKVLCDKTQVPCTLVSGYGYSSAEAKGEGHMWNLVGDTDGKYYAVDVTWNDPYLSGVTDAQSGYEHRDYLMVGSDTVISNRKFSDSHQILNQVFSGEIQFLNQPAMQQEKYKTSLQDTGERLAGYTLSLNGKIGVHFHMELTDRYLQDEDAYMLLEMPGVGKTQVRVADAERSTIQGANYYTFSYEVPSYYVSIPISVKMVDGQNNSATEYAYTVQQYAEYIVTEKETYTEQDVAFAKALLNYGAAAQSYFLKNPGELANTSLSEEDKKTTSLEAKDLEPYMAELTQTGEGKLPGQFTGFNLILQSGTTFKVYFTPEEGADISTLRFTIDGAEVVPVSDNAGSYILAVDNIKAWDLDRRYQFMVSDGTASTTFTASAFSYGYGVLQDAVGEMDTFKPVLNALYDYWDKAQVYDKNSLME